MADGAGAETELDVLHEVTQRLMRAETEQEICDVAVTAVPELFDVPFGGLWLYDAEATELQLTAETEQSAKLLDGDVVYRPGNSISWEAFESGEIRLFQGEKGDGQEYNDDTRISCELALPVGEYGVMNVGSYETDRFSPLEMQIGKLLAVNVETALDKAEREHALQVKNDRLEEFVGIVSHDLRNPLTVADGNLTLARADHDTAELSNVADALGRMETLIDELLTLAEQGYVVEDRTSLDLSTLASEAWSNVHTPEAALDIKQTATVFGDETRLLQVFENLFRNAIDHAGTDVKIRVGPLERFHTATRVSVADHKDGFFVMDDGPGIPDDEQSAVFESGHSATGTGLGLAIVRRIIEAHGWQITAVDGVSGSGARFEITDGTKLVAPFSSD
jgi:signal transduction histidine kinase